MDSRFDATNKSNDISELQSKEFQRVWMTPELAGESSLKRFEFNNASESKQGDLLSKKFLSVWLTPELLSEIEAKTFSSNSSLNDERSKRPIGHLTGEPQTALSPEGTSPHFDAIIEAAMIKNQITRYHAHDESALQQSKNLFCDLTEEQRNLTAKELLNSNAWIDFARTNATIERSGDGKLIGISFTPDNKISASYPYLNCEK